MPLSAQPPGRRGTVGHPYSALGLRLALATFGLVVCTVFAVLLFLADQPVFAGLLALLAVIAVADLVVIQLRPHASRDS